MSLIEPKQDSATQKHHALTPEARRYQLLKLFGDFTVAYSGWRQPVLQHFNHESGYIPFAKKWGFTFVLGDPIADKQDYPPIIDDFLTEHRNADFVQVSAATAEVLSSRKYWVNEMGYDTHLNLDRYDFAGKTKEKIRYAWNWLERRGFQVQEVSGSNIPIEQVREVSDSWRSTRTIKSREVIFLNRPIEFGAEKDVRKFLLYDSNDQLVAFAFFDPLYRNNQVVGYTTVIKRRRPDAPLYAETGLIKKAVEQFKEEGAELVTLGLSPLAGMDNDRFKPNPIVRFGWNYGYNAWWVNRFFYNLKGHAQYKNHFHGDKVKNYYCTRALFTDLRVTAMLRLMRVL